MRRHRNVLAAIGIVAMLLTPLPAGAVNPDEMLADPALEARARELSAEIRCMKCQNQSIDDSDADLARDLRILVRERISAGDTNRQVLDYLVDRYGDFVLLKPRFTATNLVLWLAPLAMLAAAIAISAGFMRRRRQAPAGPAKLSSKENAELNKILGDRD